MHPRRTGTRWNLSAPIGVWSRVGFDPSKRVYRNWFSPKQIRQTGPSVFPSGLQAHGEGRRLMTRQRFFALKYVRLLTKTASAQELGASTCWLLSLIACQEDVKGFTEPAKFYFDQLIPLCGFGSKKQLRNAIAKAVELGWLDYLPGRKGIPGRFSVRVPTKFSELAPFACDESSERVPSAEPQTEMQTVMGALGATETAPKRHRNGNPSLPVTTSTPIESSSPSPESILAAFNEATGRKYQLTPKRRTATLARIKEPFFASNLEAAIAKVASSAFCQGQNDRGWQADFEWFVRQDSVTKIMEGKYDSQKSQPRTTARAG